MAWQFCISVLSRLGNGVSASDAVKLYLACQGTNDRCRKMAETQMYGWYMQWAMCGTARNIFYYNMKKCVLWSECVELEVAVLNFGPTQSLRPMRTI